MSVDLTTTLTKPNRLGKRKTSKISNGHARPRPRPEDSIWRLSVDRYHQMIETGILTDDDPVELLEGWLIQKMPKGPHHSAAIYNLRQAFEEQFAEGWYINAQDAITLADSEPEPDVFVARGNSKQFYHRHPYAEELVLIVEVSDATLSRDRNLKKRVYAQAGIPAYWIVNLVDNMIEVYTEPAPNPSNPSYLQRKDYGITESVPLLVADKVIGTISVADMIASE